MEEIEELQDEEWHTDAQALHAPKSSRSYAFTAAITLLIAAYANRSLTGTALIKILWMCHSLYQVRSWHASRLQTKTRRKSCI